MDSILEIDKSEIRQLKETIAAHRDLFVNNAPQLFEDCFHLILSSGAKPDAFHLIKHLSYPNNQESDALNALFNAVLIVCSHVFRVNLKGWEEFSHVVEELGLKARA